MSGKVPEPPRDLAALRALRADGTTRLGVVGWPIDHSASPALHGAALATLAAAEPSFAAWEYRAYALRPEELAEALPLAAERGFRGLNLTVPHKVEVLPLVDRLAPSAERIGAVNTLLWEEDGLHGLNTDGYGLEEGLREAFGLGMAGQSVLVLGAGGAARAAVAEAVHQGAARAFVANRTEDRAVELARRFAGGVTEVAAVPLADAGHRAEPGTLVVNATSLGLRPGDPQPFPAAELPERCLLYDMVYNPPETPWLAAGRARGYPVANGLGMLLHQGARALEIWTDRPAPLAPMREALEGFLAGA